MQNETVTSFSFEWIGDKECQKVFKSTWYLVTPLQIQNTFLLLLGLLGPFLFISWKFINRFIIPTSFNLSHNLASVFILLIKWSENHFTSKIKATLLGSSFPWCVCVCGVCLCVCVEYVCVWWVCVCVCGEYVCVWWVCVCVCGEYVCVWWVCLYQGPGRALRFV